MKDIVIHIGSHKTGSTFLQKKLTDSAELLKSKKILYPESWKFLWGHHRVPEMLSSEEGATTFYREFDTLSNEEAMNVILSSENFESIPEQAIERLHPISNFGKVRIVFYYREFQSLAYSLWQEEIKHGSGEIFPRFLFDHISRPFMSDVLNPSVILDKFSKIFGKENIYIFHYDKEMLSEGNLYTRFIKGIYNIQVPADKNEAVNISFDPIDIEIIRALNFKACLSGRKVSNNIREKYIDLVKLGEIKSKKEKIEFSFEEIEIDKSTLPIGSVVKAFYAKYSDRIVSNMNMAIDNSVKYSYASPNTWLVPENNKLLNEIYKMLD